ncbi:MAG: ATP-binding cassette domain-containing protein [Candidatus Muirbacterium halophilum]|nr:ATP-binding cassette domain-containing protein [Candidatus Muirbacterium halophilum]MCK9474897.1 ATP-binding cassette domain-containing protein [Candidatus Muirbacterium halophilum]
MKTFDQYKKDNIILSVQALKKFFPVYGGVFGRKKDYVKAVDGIFFDLIKGKTLGLVGESGCGKSTTGRSIINIYKPDSGDIIYNDFSKNESVNISKGKNQRKYIAENLQMIFQDPYASLNPRMKVSKIVEEPLIVHKYGNKNERRDKVIELFENVGIEKTLIDRYPHEFSGGQRQRVGIARALALNPSIIIADEPVSALDVSVQAQVLNLMKEIQDRLGLTFLFIAHDLSVVQYISHNIAVMYLGKIVEISKAHDLYKNPLHPYTKALMSSVPIPDPKARERYRIRLKGDIPGPFNIPTGCAFRTRCPYAFKRCEEETPQIRNMSSEHFVACHLEFS